jgi:hypothetical protein
VFERLREFIAIVALHPPADLAWHAYTRLQRRVFGPARTRPAEGLQENGWPSLDTRRAFVPPLRRQSPQVAELIAGRFRVFGSGPHAYHTRDGSPSHATGAPPEDDPPTASGGARPMVAAGYRFIDWQLDVESGHRWNSRTPSHSLTIGVPEGVDIKIPWEIGRFQGLPLLALAWEPGSASAIAETLEGLVVDFVETNPLGRGVHWVSGLEVAIRALNWLIAVELLSAKGYPFRSDWTRVVLDSLHEHGQFLQAHLSWVPRGRNNHYLGEVVGLLALGACLPPSERTDAWLAHGTQELEREVLYQFLPDGGSFEGSTAYHGFACELALLGTTLCLGAHGSGRTLSADVRLRPRGAPPLRRAVVRRWGTVPGGSRALFGSEFWRRLQQAGWFLEGIEMPGGMIPQIGDNDSGRVTKLDLSMVGPHEPCGFLPGDERLLDYRTIRHAMHVLASGTDAPGGARGVLSDWVGFVVEGDVIATGGGGTTARRSHPPAPRASEHGFPTEAGMGATVSTSVEAEWNEPDRAYRYRIRSTVDLLDGLEVLRCSDFGLVVYRSPNLFLAIRCPSRRTRHPRAGHMHADELSIELAIGGAPVIRDPGTGSYTSDIARRNRFRGRLAHFTPVPEFPLPAGMRGLFVGPLPIDVTVEEATVHQFHAAARVHGQTYRRTISIEPQSVVIVDSATVPWEPKIISAWKGAYSPRYGLVVSCQ